jgi:hypothetical protein
VGPRIGLYAAWKRKKSLPTCRKSISDNLARSLVTSSPQCFKPFNSKRYSCLPVFNYAAYYEDLCGTGDIDPHILNLGSRCI